jgi:hypothetical protein
MVSAFGASGATIFDAQLLRPCAAHVLPIDAPIASPAGRAVTPLAHAPRYARAPCITPSTM